MLLGPRRRPRPAARAADALEGIDLDAYSGDVRAAALREAARIAADGAAELDEAEFVTYGHIVVDEAQDLSPMELRVLHRRDLAGSMTIVGDMGQATTPSSPASWDAVARRAVAAPRAVARRPDGELPHARGGPRLRRADAARGRARARARRGRCAARAWRRASRWWPPTRPRPRWSAAARARAERGRPGPRRGHRRRPRGSTRLSRPLRRGRPRRRRTRATPSRAGSRRTWSCWPPRRPTGWSSTRSSCVEPAADRPSAASLDGGRRPRADCARSTSR